MPHILNIFWITEYLQNKFLLSFSVRWTIKHYFFTTPTSFLCILNVMGQKHSLSCYCEALACSSLPWRLFHWRKIFLIITEKVSTSKKFKWMPPYKNLNHLQKKSFLKSSRVFDYYVFPFIHVSEIEPTAETKLFSIRFFFNMVQINFIHCAYEQNA